MPNKNKIRGDNFERSIVNMLRSNGFTCERTLERGARSDGSPTWDIDLKFNDDTLRIECKVKKNGFKFIYDSLGNNDILICKQDRCSPFYVLSEEMMLKLLHKGIDDN